MAVPHDRITAVLLAAANAAELLPYLAENRIIRGVCDRHHYRVGGFFFSTASSSLAGEVLPSEDQTWLTLSAFDHLTVTPPAQTKIDRASHLATLLRRRMRFLELLVRVSMTRQCDWQTCIANNTSTQDGFSWQPVLQKLTGDTWFQPHTQRCVATMRWRHPRFLIQWDHDLPDNVPEMLEIFLMGIATKPESADDWMEDVTLRQLFQEERKHHTTRGDETRVVELGVAICAGRVTTSLLFHFVEVLQRFGEFQYKQRQQRTQRQQQHIEFRVTTLAFTSLCAVASSALENLGALVRSSRYLHIQEIKIGHVGEMEDQCVQQCISDWIVPASASAPVKAAAKADEETKTRIPTHPSSYGLKRLFLETPAKPFAVVGATARCDTSLQQITTSYSATDMDSMAAWLAFGFFHRDSATSVARVALRMPGHTDFDERTPPYTACTRQFVETFARVLRATVASLDLAPLDAKTTRSATRKRKRDEKPSPLEEAAMPDQLCVFVELKTSTKARRQPLASSAVIATLAAATEQDQEQDEDEQDEELPFQRLTQFQVLRRLREWVAVVVPGFGAGWIPLSAVSREWTRPSDSPSDSSHSHGIRSFSWTGGSLPLDPELKLEHGDALMELLALIGEPLTTLQLPSMFLQNHHVAQILTHCPNLQELNLYGNRITDVAPLVESYARGGCRISSLNVAQHSEIHDVVARQCIEILRLCNPTNHPHQQLQRKAQQLTRLVVRLSPYAYDDEIYYFTDVIPQLFEALLVDPALEYVRVHSDTDHQYMVTDELAVLKHRMRASHHRRSASDPAAAPRVTASDPPPAATESDPEAPPVGVLATNLRSRSLPLKCTLAMLSVVHHASAQLSALSSLDEGVLAMVLEMAGTCQPRVIDIVGDQIVL